MRLVPLAAFVLCTASAFATTMTIGRQPDAPVQLVSVTHGLTDSVESARLKNQSSRVIVAYRVGWSSARRGRTVARTGQWMNLPAGIQPDEIISVPGQNIALERQADSMTFYVAEVTFADGSHWKASPRTFQEK